MQLVVGLTLWFGAAVASAQVMPNPVMPNQARTAPASAPPDTLTLTLAGPPGVPEPVLRSAGPDSVLFGGELTVICDHAAAGSTPVDSVTVDADWAEIVAAERGDGDFTLRLRLTRAGPFRLAWSGGPPTHQVLHVVGRLGPADQPDPLRDPRGLGWRLGRLLAALLIAAALLWLWRRLRRRGPPETGEDDPLLPPAWLRAAVDLAALLDEGLASRGEGRAFLHRLDLVCRRFLADRYHVGAVEMTPDEIRAALRDRHHPPELGERFASLLDDCDRLRFAPGEPAASVCHDLLAAVVAAVAEVRIEARWTPVPPALEREAALAWNRLRGLVPAPAGEGASGV